MSKTPQKWPPTISMDAAGLYEPIKKLAELALRFSKVDRATRLLDGSPESDTDHTVMLAWVAPALAARCADDLDVGLVCQFAVVHDAPEVFAGDTPTLRITAEQRAVKAERERLATRAWALMFATSLPWLPEMIYRYEGREEREARFVWALDKVIVKIANLAAGCYDITAQRVTAEEFVTMRTEQRSKLEEQAGEFDGLLRLYDRLCAEVEARLRELALPLGALDNMAAAAVTFEESGHVAIVHEPGACDDRHGSGSCMFCDGGLFGCQKCDSFEGATTTHCPGVRMTAEQHDAVYAGDLDYRRRPDGVGEWLPVGSPHTPNRGWQLPYKPLPGEGLTLDEAMERIKTDYAGALKELKAL